MDLVDQAGTRLVLGARIGGGGEGDVHALTGRPDLCVKLLHATRRRGKHDKILAMMAAPPQGALDLVEGVPVLTWPRAAVYAGRPGRPDTFVGYVMTRIRPTDFVPFHQVTAAARRAGLGGQPLTFDRLVLLGLRLAHVVRTLHRFGYAIGDLNDRNVLVSRRLTPLVMDTDSFEVPNGRGRFPSTVGDALYWPPDLLDTDLRTYTGSRLPGDRYALAVLLFQLFMGGLRPYQARGRAVDDLPTVEAKARAGLYPWARPRPGELEPPANSPPYAALPATLRDAFERCFVTGHHKPRARPTADDWCTLLTQLHTQGFQVCPREARHVYPRGQRRCPWCPAAAAATAQDPFTAVARPARPSVMREVVAPARQPRRAKRAKSPPQRTRRTAATLPAPPRKPVRRQSAKAAARTRPRRSATRTRKARPVPPAIPTGWIPPAGQVRAKPRAVPATVGQRSVRWLTLLTGLLLAAWWLAT